MAVTIVSNTANPVTDIAGNPVTGFVRIWPAGDEFNQPPWNRAVLLMSFTDGVSADSYSIDASEYRVQWIYDDLVNEDTYPLVANTEWCLATIDGVTTNIQTIQDNSTLAKPTGYVRQSETTLQAEITTLTADLATATALNTGYLSQINSLNTDLATANSNLDDCNVSLNTANATISTQTTEIAGLNTQITNLNTQIDTLNTTIDDLNTQITTLQAELDQQDIDHAAELAAKDAECQTLIDAAVQTLQDECDAIAAQLQQDLVDQQEMHEQELAELQAEIDALLIQLGEQLEEDTIKALIDCLLAVNSQSGVLVQTVEQPPFVGPGSGSILDNPDGLTVLERSMQVQDRINQAIASGLGDGGKTQLPETVVSRYESQGIPPSQDMTDEQMTNLDQIIKRFPTDLSTATKSVTPTIKPIQKKSKTPDIEGITSSINAVTDTCSKPNNDKRFTPTVKEIRGKISERFKGITTRIEQVMDTCASKPDYKSWTPTVKEIPCDPDPSCPSNTTSLDVIVADHKPRSPFCVDKPRDQSFYVPCQHGLYHCPICANS